MPELDPRAILLGLGLGIILSSFFFIGLDWSLRWALRARQPALVLVLSFVLRSAVLLIVAWWLARQPGALWSLPAYMLAFFLVRSLVLRRARYQRTILSKNTKGR